MATGIIRGITDSTAKLTLSKYSGTVLAEATINFTVTSTTVGTLYAFSSDTSIASTSISNKKITIRGKKSGKVSIIVVEYNASANSIITSDPFICTVGFNATVNATLENNSWDIIKEVSINGLGSSYWSVGDTKSITLNGKIGTLSLNNFVCKVFILHFNHPINKTIADNNIIWGGFKSSTGVNIALIDSIYDTDSTAGTSYFNINHYSNNLGGWKGSDFRFDILGATSLPPNEYGTTHTTVCIGYDATQATLMNSVPNTLLAALPADFRAVLRLWRRWIDAAGNKSNVNANIKETVDAVTLLTEFEVFGTRKYANTYEKNHQIQMEYYQLGNDKYKYKEADLPAQTAIKWWLASPAYNNTTNFLAITTSNTIGTAASTKSFGIAPAFRT